MASVNWQPGTHPSIPTAVWTRILAANGARKAYTIINEDAANAFRIARQADAPDQRRTVAGIGDTPAKLDVEDITLSETDPVLVTIEDHGLTTGDKLTFLGVVGSTELNENEYTITVEDEDTFTLDDTDSSDFTAYESGGTVHVAAPVVVEIPEHGFATGDEVVIAGVEGATEINGTFTITKIDGNSFSLDDTDGGTITPYTSGGTVRIPDAAAGFPVKASGTVECDYDRLDKGAVWAYQASGGALTSLFVQEAN